MKKLFSLLIILILISTVNAADLTQVIDDASADVSSFFDSIPREELVIVTGSKISVEDKILFNMLKSNLNLQGFTIVDDIHFNDYDKNVVLIGSEKTNLISKELTLNNRTEKDFAPLILDKSMNGKYKVLMLYSKKEKINLENQAVLKSPLNDLMDEKYVPVAATFLSILMLYLWQVLGKTAMELLNEAISSKLLDKWSQKKKIKKHEILNKSEIIVFIVYVLVFSFIMAYSWSIDFKDCIKLMPMTIAIVGLISLARETIRLNVCHKHKFKSEYVMWPFGTVVTLVSTFLGNTFSLAAYTLLDEDETDLKKFGKLSFFISLFTFLFGIFTYVLNIFMPSVVLQMMFVFSIMVVFIELFPMNPMPGYDIKKWSLPLWLVSYIVVFITYMYMNFTVYI